MEELRHSGLGIASFVLSIVASITLFVVFAVAGVIEASTPGGMDENSAAAVIVGLLIIGVGGGLLLATGLGIAGLLVRRRRRVFAILGVIFSVLTLAGTIGLIAFGLSLG